MMNETGNYPGQTWLWLYSMWYQVPPFNTAPNADLPGCADDGAADHAPGARSIYTDPARLTLAQFRFTG